MDLKRIAARYDTDTLVDAYTGEVLYKGQFASYDGSQLDGSFIRRRTVSMRPEYVLPERRAVRVHGQVWILSDPVLDGFKGKTVRQTMSARLSHGLFGIRTPGQAARGDVPTREAYAYKRWVSNTADAPTSYQNPFYEFSFAKSEGAISKMFLSQDGNLFSVRVSEEVAEGFIVAECDLVVEAASLDKWVTVEVVGEFDPVTLQPTIVSSCTGLLVERYLLFKKLDQDSPSNYANDKTLLVAKSDVEKPEEQYKINGKTWKRKGHDDLLDAWAVHVEQVQ